MNIPIYTDLSDWIPISAYLEPRTTDDRLTGPRLCDPISLQQIKEFTKKFNEILWADYNQPEAPVPTFVAPKYEYTISYEMDDEKCECGSGNNAIGPGHSDWCQRYLP